MLNRIVIMGRLTRDPELRYTPNEVPVANFCVACDRDYQSGNKEVDFIDCIAWRKTGEFVSRYFQKGRMIVVEGRLQISTWKNQNGENRRRAEIVADSVYFGDSKPQNDQVMTELPDNEELPF